MGLLRNTRATGAVAAAAFAALSAAGCMGGDDEDATVTRLSAGKPAPVEVGRNVARVPGRSPSDVAAAAVLAGHADGGPRGWLLVPTDDWTNVAVAAQFAASPVGAAIMPIEREYIPTGPADVIGRLEARGFPRAKGLAALVLGRAGDDVFAELQDRGLKLTQLKAPSPAELSLKAVPFRGGWAAAHSSSVVVVSSEARDFALPAIAWSAYSGDTVAFVDRRGVPARTAALLQQRRKLRIDKPSIYVLGSARVVPERVMSELRRFGTVKRLPGGTPAEAAVELARYRDRGTGFGWGMAKGPATVSLVNPRDWANAVGALNFAAAGPQAPVLLTDPDGSLPPGVKRYLRGVRVKRPGQAFVFGDAQSVPSRTVGALDGLL